MSDWHRSAIIYQIYPRSFRDANGDGIGDLKGITEKLDYIASLGVDAIWLSPFFTSPMKDYGYDVSNYTDVDPLFGTLADADALITRAHQLNLKLIIDLVYSHSSDQHPWFTESRASRDNEKADWYVWADAKPDGAPPNNWQAMFGGPAWTWDSRRRQYYLHNFLPEQPDLNVRNPQVQNALLDATRFWLDRGIDGFRLDVVNFYTHDEQLRDNPPIARNKPPARPHQFQRHLYDRTQPDTLQFIAKFRALLDQYKAISVGEIEDEEPLKVQRAYTEGADKLHTAYSFFLLRANEATPQVFAEAMEGWQSAQGWPSWSFSNHDVIRFPTRLAHDDPQRTKQMLALLLSLRGTPFLYQGDELGLSHANVPFDRLRDPEAIAFWPNGIGRDGARTPMPWSASASMAGFTEAKDAWLPLDPRHRDRAADTQQHDPNSILATTRALIALRKAHPALQTGAFTELTAPPNVLAFIRTEGAARIVCVFNLGDSPATLDLPAPSKATLWSLGDVGPTADAMKLGAYAATFIEI